MAEKHPLLCDMETGVCGAGSENEHITIKNLTPPEKTIDVYYVTDPICSHCWALEPVLRRFTTQYGDYFHFHTVMGGLLEKWSDTPVDPGNGIAKPSDVAGHWREVGVHSRMPIDGSLWFDHPVHSSYPPSRVFKVIQKHYGDELATTYLRRAREALFAFNRNIAEESTMIDIVNGLGIDGQNIVEEAERKTGHSLLLEDFQLAGRLGVRGFPTIIMLNQEKQGVKVVGARSIEHYVEALKQVLDTDELQPSKLPALPELLQREKLLFSKEVEMMYDRTPQDISSFIEQELAAGQYQTHELLGEMYLTAKD